MDLLWAPAASFYRPGAFTVSAMATGLCGTRSSIAELPVKDTTHIVKDARDRSGGSDVRHAVCRSQELVKLRIRYCCKREFSGSCNVVGGDGKE